MISSSRLAFAAVLAFAASPAIGAVTVIGDSYARSCYEAAEFKRPVRESLRECTIALDETALSTTERAATFVNRGIVHMYGGDLARAIADYDAALAIDANLAEAYVNRGIALVHRGDAHRKALADLTRGIELSPSRPEVAYFSRGVANESLGNARAAYSDYRKAAALKPEWDAPRIELRRFKVVPANS